MLFSSFGVDHAFPESGLESMLIQPILKQEIVFAQILAAALVARIFAPEIVFTCAAVS